MRVNSILLVALLTLAGFGAPNSFDSACRLRSVLDRTLWVSQQASQRGLGQPKGLATLAFARRPLNLTLGLHETLGQSQEGGL